jgi:hypothetical protein
MKLTAVTLLIACLVFPAFSGEPEHGALCVAPAPLGHPVTSATHELVCHSGNLSLKVDKQQAILWPHKDSLKIGNLDVKQSHQIVVLCEDKPQQSFSFRFSEFKTKKLCLFINDLYQTAQLWDSSKSVWCKCK